MTELTISDKVCEAAAVADAISTISLCIAHTNANLNLEHRADDVFKGLETLGRALSDMLSEISDESWDKEHEIDKAKQELKTLSGKIDKILPDICDELGDKESKGGDTI